MDGDEDHGWDGPNIRPPQASSGEDKYQRQRNFNARRDRQVFVSKRDDSMSKGHRRSHDESHGRRGGDHAVSARFDDARFDGTLFDGLTSDARFGDCRFSEMGHAISIRKKRFDE